MKVNFNAFPSYSIQFKDKLFEKIKLLVETVEPATDFNSLVCNVTSIKEQAKDFFVIEFKTSNLHSKDYIGFFHLNN